MPNQQVSVLRITHLGLERLAGQIGINVLLEVACVPFRMCLLRVYAVDILLEACLNLWVLRSLRGIILAGKVEVMVSTV